MNNKVRVHLLQIVGLLIVVSFGCLGVPRATREIVSPTEQLAVVASSTPAPTAAPLVVAPAGSALQDLQTQVEAVYAAAGDSVVNIAVTVMAYDYFYNAMPQEGTGSGFVYDDQGHIVTNYHVVEGAETINVTFADGATLMAEVVGEDPTYDLAVVKVDPTAHELHPVVLGDSESLTIGQFVVAIGSPFGLEQSLTFGVISSLKRVIQSPDERYIGEAIQTDAAINPGNSGGPLLDLEGRVIGVNAQIISTSESSAGIGFAIPVRLVKGVVPELIETGTYQHPWMGVGPVGLTSQLVQIIRDAGYDVPDEGVLLISVDDGSAAEQAGLRGAQRRINTRYGTIPVGGDVILSLNGTSILDASDLVAYLETYTVPGDVVTVQISRDGELLEVLVTLGERPVE